MRHIRGRNLQAETIVPAPQGWKFLPGEEQLQIMIGTSDLPRYKLVFNKGGFLGPYRKTALVLPPTTLTHKLF